MKKQTITLLAALAAIVTFSASLVACHDDLEGDALKYNDGYVRFKLRFDDQGAWNEDGSPKNTTRLLAPIEMEQSIEDGQTLYLHCVETSKIESTKIIADTTAADTTAITRGQRFTEDPFQKWDSSDPTDPQAIQNFGVYVKLSDGTVVLPLTESKIERDTLQEDGSWVVAKRALKYGDDNVDWPTGATATFYGFAPFPGFDDGTNGQAQCFYVQEAEDPTNPSAPTQPVITFNMLPQEEKNKDIMTAIKPNIPLSDIGDVELEFHHILSAVKFKVDDNNANDLKNFLPFTYTVGVSTQTDYNIKVKSIKLIGIYTTGSAILGTPLSDKNATGSENNRATYWTRDHDNTIGDCTANFSRTTADVTGDSNADDYKLINTDEHCFMVLPQTTPSTAKVQFVCELYATSDTNYENPVQDIAFTADLPNMEWKAGYSYTYKISKDPVQREFTLSSQVIGDNSGTPTYTEEGSMAFDINGGSNEFRVKSTVISTVSSEEIANWHLEYRKNSTEEWKKGLPLGYSLEKGGTQVDVKKSITPTTTDYETYTLKAQERVELSSEIVGMQDHDYGGQWYDLSTHGIGYGAEQGPRSTANCYIIQGWGNFMFPLVYGNAIKKGLKNEAAFNKKWPYNATYDATGADGAGRTIDYTNGYGHGLFANADLYDIANPYINADLGREAKKAVILWKDEKNIIRESSLEIVTSDETISETDDGPIKGGQNMKQYLRFKILQEDVRPANCVLAVKDGTGDDANILWSWHIWVTPDDFTQTVQLSKTVGTETYTMDLATRNLGWRVPEIKNSATASQVYVRVVQDDLAGKKRTHSVSQGSGVLALGGANIIYQYGRKDPFPNSTVKVGSVSYSGGKVSSVTYALEDEFKIKDDGVHERIEVSETNYPAPSAAIKNPGRFINRNTSWLREQGLQTTHQNKMIYLPWNVESGPNTSTSTIGTETTESLYKDLTKTILDPCPVGFMVPNHGIYYMLNDLTWTKVTKTTLDGVEIDAPIPYLENTATGLKFYLNGCRRLRYANTDYDENGDLVTGSNSFGLTEFQQNGYLHTALSYGEYYCAYIKIDGDSKTIKNPPSNGNAVWYVSRGFAVRPVRDPNAEEVQTSSGTKVTTKYVREVDVNDVTLTRTTPTSYFRYLGVKESKESWGIEGDARDNADFKKNVTVNKTSITTTLKDIINNDDYKEKKVYLKEVRVYFTYNDNIYKDLWNNEFIGAPMRVRILPMYGQDENFQLAWAPKSEVGTNVSGKQFYDEFTPNWTRFRLENVDSELHNWEDIIPLDRLLNVTINKIEVDIRMTYVETVTTTIP